MTIAIDPAGSLSSWAENFTAATGEATCDLYDIELRVLDDGGNPFGAWIGIKYVDVNDHVAQLVFLEHFFFFQHFCWGAARGQ